MLYYIICEEGDWGRGRGHGHAELKERIQIELVKCLVILVDHNDTITATDANTTATTNYTTICLF